MHEDLAGSIIRFAAAVLILIAAVINTKRSGKKGKRPPKNLNRS